MLCANRRVAVVSPSHFHEPARLERGLEVLRSWGLRPELMPNVGRRRRYFAGSDEERLADLHAAFRGPCDAVWMVRGGSGMARLMDRVDFELPRRKPFFGFSDGTTMLNALAARGGRAIHAPVLTSLGEPWAEAHAEEAAASREHLRRLVFGERTEPFRGEAWVPGRADGPLAGGNLCVLASLCGTRWQLRAKGCIVVLEEVGEAPYKVDRLLTQLVQSGSLDGVTGIALGELRGAEPPADAEWTMKEVVLEVLGPLGVPIVAGLPVGHGPRNHAFPFAGAHLDGDTLTLDPPGDVHL